MIEWNYKNLTSKELSPLRKLFKKYKLNVTEITSTNKARRVDGVVAKLVVLTFEDGQELRLRIKPTGDLIDPRLGKIKLPVRESTDYDKAVREIADHIFSNQKHFLKNREKELKKVKVEIDSTPKVKQTRKQQLENTRNENQNLEQEYSELQAEVEKLETEITAVEEETATVQVDIQTENKRLGVEANV